MSDSNGWFPLEIYNTADKLFSVGPDGKVTFGPGFTTKDEASRVFLEALCAPLRRSVELLESARAISDQRAVRIQELEHDAQEIKNTNGRLNEQLSTYEDLLRRAENCLMRLAGPDAEAERLLSEIDEVLK